MKPFLPPDHVGRQCLRGIAEQMRLNVAAPPAAVQFAQRVAVHKAGVTKADAVQAMEAHDRIDQTVAEHGGWSKPAEICRMLWGGDSAREWFQTVIDTPEPVALPQPDLAVPVVEPVAARLNPDHRLIGRVVRELAREDDRLKLLLDAAVQAAYERILKSLTVQAALAVKRVNKDLRDSGSVCMDEICRVRAAIADAPALDGWRFLPPPVQAVLSVDQDQRVNELVAELEEETTNIFDAYYARVAAVIVATERFTETQVIAGAGSPLVERMESGASKIAEALKGFILNRLANRTVTDDRTELPTRYVDPRVVREGLNAAAGKASQRPATRLFTDMLVDSVSFERVPTTTGFRWYYGSKASRFAPYEPHYAVDGERWVEGQPGPDGQEIGDHFGCQCVADEVTLVIDGDRWVDPLTGELWN